MNTEVIKREITSEEINAFLNGRNPMERIVNMEYDYMNSYINIIYRDENGNKCEEQDPFHPFVWATRRACVKLCNGDRKKVKKLMNEYGIGIKVLIIDSIDDIPCPNIENGYIFMFYAINAMSYNKFLQFFKKAENPIFSKDNENKSDDRQYLIVTPQEQHMIATGKRYFKGYDDYDNVYRMVFDLETEGLDPHKHRIEQIGIHTNRGFEKIFEISGNSEEEKDKNELNGIETMLKIIYTYKPDVITAHNGENFDWNFIIVRCDELGLPLSTLSAKYFNGKYIFKQKRQTVLKLGGEVEYFYPTIVPGINVTDSLHAVRRAQAIDSNMQKADLKYVTKYSKMKKPDRVYVPGDKISIIYNDFSESYAFNDEDGDWYKMTDDKPLINGYRPVSGRYIVNRYLLDDLWECDKVELRYNQPNFLLCKLLPTTFTRCCTMGTAAQWKLLMLAWSYENNLAIPPFGKAGKFTGGLSRLLKTGYVNNVVKLDYNSLYPSIILTWKIKSPQDLQKVLLAFLEYILTQREKYKKLKKKAGKEKERVEEMMSTITDDESKLHELQLEYNKWAEEESSNDKKQLPLKIFGNSYFGGTGNPSLFPFSNLTSAEKTTCIGRQCLRLMIKWFSDKGYDPIVGDSFTGDTPLFIKYKDSGLIDIKPISEIIDENNIQKDLLDREYDYSNKPYYVLCRSGWHEVEYIYRHKTNKNIFEITDGNTKINVTEDHSLFDNEQNKLNPNDITDNTKLEYYSGKIYANKNLNNEIAQFAQIAATFAVVEKCKKNEIDRIPIPILNGDKKIKSLFIDVLEKNNIDLTNKSKTFIAGLLYLKNCLNK